MIWAVNYFTSCRQAFAGLAGKGFGFVVDGSHHGMASVNSRWLSIIEMLPEIHLRLMRVQIECSDFRRVLKNFDRVGSFFYLDPPYVLRTRRSGGYNHELTDDDHRDLVEMVINLQGTCVLSCYWDDIYQPLLTDKWKRVDFPTACNCVGRTRLTGLKGKGICKLNQPRLESVLIFPRTIKLLNMN